MKKIGLILLIALAGFSLSWAEELRIVFMDRDLEWPLEGVMVQIVGQDEIYYSDMDGQLILDLDLEGQRMVMLAQYPGYDSIRHQLKSGETDLQLDMVIAGVIEGQELVVERSAPGETDEEVGISTVLDAEELDTTANIGLVEDVMSSIKTLPGVGYSGGWSAMPSIRGGDPSTMAATLDGIYITMPYHWGGAFSIFNPNMTESAKLSHGVFSSRYGRALSGLLEVSSKETEDEFRADMSISTTSTDLFLQVPLSDRSGLFLGGKVTYMEATLALTEASTGEDTGVSTPPYIRDFYGKWNFRPTNNLQLFFNGFLGTDGTGIAMNIEADGISTELAFDYQYTNSFVTMGAEWAPTPQTLISLSGGYNFNFMEVDSYYKSSGSREYSQGFLDQFDNGSLPGDTPGDGLIYGESGYTLTGLDYEGDSLTSIHQGQLRIEADQALNEDNILSFGIDEVFYYTEVDSTVSYYANSYASGSPELQQITASNVVKGNRSIHSSLYALWEFGSDHSRLTGELGIRGEHVFLWNDGFDLHFQPVANPRLHLAYDLLEDRGDLQSLTLSMGSGVFSQFPIESSIVRKEFGFENFEVTPDQSFYQIVGAEARAWNDWKFSLESYYKYFFNTLYVIEDRTVTPSAFEVKQDGHGYALGFDCMVQKEVNRYWDGYLSYSFVYARRMNPYSPPTADHVEALRGAPLDQWFYPSYHRFHTANLVVNFRPFSGWTFTATASFASGTPMEEKGEVEAFPAPLNGETIELYGREDTYSDSLRTEFSIPVDIRISRRWYPRNGKWEAEFYFGVEDILVNLYSPQGETTFNSFTGEEQPGGADFNMGIPIPSFGYKFSY